MYKGKRGKGGRIGGGATVRTAKKKKKKKKKNVRATERLTSVFPKKKGGLQGKN